MSKVGRVRPKNDRVVIQPAIQSELLWSDSDLHCYRYRRHDGAWSDWIFGPFDM